MSSCPFFPFPCFVKHFQLFCWMQRKKKSVGVRLNVEVLVKTTESLYFTETQSERLQWIKKQRKKKQKSHEKLLVFFLTAEKQSEMVIKKGWEKTVEYCFHFRLHKKNLMSLRIFFVSFPSFPLFLQIHPPLSNPSSTPSKKKFETLITFIWNKHKSFKKISANNSLTNTTNKEPLKNYKESFVFFSSLTCRYKIFNDNSWEKSKAKEHGKPS